jgi:hypothetical protein
VQFYEGYRIMKTTLIATLLLCGSLSPAAPALAESNEAACTKEPAAKWIGEDAAKTAAIGSGLDVRDIKVENSCYEIYALDKTGKRIQVVMNPITGQIVGNEEGED